MRKPLLVLWAVVLLAAAASSNTNVDNDIIFDEAPIKESDQPFYKRILNRVKRQWLFSWGRDDKTSTTESTPTEDTSASEETSPTSSTTPATASSRETRSPDEEDNAITGGFAPDDEDNAFGGNSGSGEPGPIPSEFVPDDSKTLYRMTLLVEEAWNDNFQTRASQEYNDFANKLQNDIDNLYESQPGQQRSEVIRIEKKDAFLVLVTVDLESVGNSNANQLSELIRNQINSHNRIGSHTVNSDKFTFNPFKGCNDDEMQCTISKVCIPLSSRCDGTIECPDSEDENGCEPSAFPSFPEFGSSGLAHSPPTPSTSETPDTLPEVPSSTEASIFPEEPIEKFGSVDLQAPPISKQCRADNEEAILCKSDGTTVICSGRICDGNNDCPQGEDEENCPNRDCAKTEFACDITRCIPAQKYCNGIKDCADGTDEKDCAECKSGYFCDGRCISVSQRCDGTNDCSDGSDEANCIRCSPSQFTCSDGNCINKSQVCNNFTDCPDNSDESNCPSEGECLPNEFRCKNGVCINSDFVCDDLQDCTDGSDEINCKQRACDSNDFRCADNTCISKSLQCNGRVDCPDGTDEEDQLCRTTCNQEDEFQCNSGECIALDKRCDGFPDCRDGSDETNNDCPATSTTTTTTTTEPYIPPCNSWEFTCPSNRQCIQPSQVCDSFRDCPDGSDEFNCVITTQKPYPPSCKPWEFRCWQDGYCIPNERHCDNNRDCSDGSDEENCAGLPFPNLKIYEPFQIIKESREAVFQCRDEGPTRYKVKWTRENGLPLPPGSRVHEGRLEMPNIQREHSGTYYCEAIGVPPSSFGARVAANLTVEQLVLPTRPFEKACGFGQATCYNRECIPKEYVCDGKYDCGDGSDESRCHEQFCEPNEFRCNNRKCVLKTWRCDKDDDCGDNSDEYDCGGQGLPGGSSGLCFKTEFQCKSGGQCIPRSYQCDGSNDCQDGSDEVGCYPMRFEPIRTPYVTLTRGSTLVLVGRAYGVPIPEISWRKDWRHVPPKCTQTSINGTGTLTCPDIQPEDSGAYSIEAINFNTYIISPQDIIVHVIGGCTNDSCSPGTFCAGQSGECVKCFCFGITSDCQSADLHIYQIPPPTSEFMLLNVFITPTTVDVRRGRSSLQHRRTQDGFSVQTYSPYYQSLGRGNENVYSYYALPETYHRNQLKSYGGYLTYTVQIDTRGGQISDIPDIIITGNKQTLLYKHPNQIPENYPTKVSARFFEGNDWQVLTEQGVRRRASREDIMMTLVNVDNILIRIQYSESQGSMTTLSNVVMDSAQYSNTGLGKAYYIEQCMCPAGYNGLSCESCDAASNYTRTPPPPWLGQCTQIQDCPEGYYGDPLRGIPCNRCPCPHPYPPNQFGQTCVLDPDGGPRCNCPRGYGGRRCEYCEPGFIGDPNKPGDYCREATPCNATGSYSPYYRDGKCECKANVVGPDCSQCAPHTFYLSPQNQYGCISCFCMGITDDCSESRLYRDQIIASFARDDQEFQLAPEDDVSNPVPITVGQNSIQYSAFEPKVYYWVLPRRFLGNQLNSYGGSLSYTIRYVASPGGLSSRNNAADVKLFSRNRVNLYHYRNITVEPDRDQVISVPILEQYWQREDGGITDRENFLMALDDLDAIYIKATYTTSTQFASLQDVYLDTASTINFGRGHAYEVEECRCPVGYKGLSCETCDVGYKRANEGVYLGLCEKCECNGRSEQCNPETGECYNCRDNFSGPRCDLCPSNIINNGICNPDSCKCDPRGEARSGCPNGQCDCKVNVEGISCDRCRPGTFNLSAENLLGCADCYCSDVSRTCQSSNLYYEPFPMQILSNSGDHGFVLTDRNGHVTVREGFETNPARNEIGYRIAQSQNDYFWSLPAGFTGDKITSYGGNLIYSQRVILAYDGYLQADHDVILNGHGNSIYWENFSPERSNLRDITQNVVVPIREGVWRKTDPRTGHAFATRREILEVLSQLSSILIRASFGPETVHSYLSDVALDIGIPSHRSGRPAPGVEICACPPNYKGTSCQQCDDHYYKDYDGTCKKCDCNDNEISCSLGPNNVIQCLCQTGYSGDHCEVDVAPSPDISTPSPPYITVTIDDPESSIQIKQVGSTVRYRCSGAAKGAGQISLRWSRQGGELPRGRHSDDYQGNLEIYDVRESDSGSYVCTASDGRTTVTNYVVLQVGPLITSPTVQISPSQIDVREGEPIEIDCQARGSPQPSIEWRRTENTALNPNIIIRNGYLRIPSASKSDEGVYECIARNPAGSMAKTITVYVAESQQVYVSVSPPGGRVFIGESITLNCGGIASYDSEIEWRRVDGRPFTGQRSGSQLIFSRPRFEDSGDYLCIIRSRSTGRIVGQSQARITIDTIVPVSYPSVEPRQQRVPQGLSAQFDCRVPYDSYSGERNVQWYKVNGAISPRAEYLNNGRTLRIPSLSIDDRGMYVCYSVFNGRPYNISAILEVDRREKPTIELYPSDRRQILSVGNSLLLQCRVEGIPIPTIRWARADNINLPGHVVPSHSGTLRFNRVQLSDAGEYICTAENEAGSAVASAFIEVQSPPVITVFPSDTVYLAAGENLDLSCRAEGAPTPTVQWTKQYPDRDDNEPLGRFNDIAATPNSGHAEYQVFSVTQEDTGTYYCVARNDANVEFKPVQVYVDDTRRPDIVPNGHDSFWVASGSDTQISCGEENRGLERRWIRADMRSFPIGVTQRDGTLYIRAASRLVEGQYVCLLLDSQGSELKRIEQYISVKELPEITLEPPTQVVRPGDDAEIRCSARGEEPIEITWTLEARNNFPHNVEVIGGLLSFKGITESNAGKYVCKAKNTAGLREATADVIVNESSGGHQPRVSVVGDRNRETIQGSVVQLHCISDVPSQISWSKSNEPLPSSASISGDYLRIMNIQPHHAGRYICSSRSPNGYVSTDYIDLKVSRYSECPGGFQCRTGECIPLIHRCDNVQHCSDASDELGCPRRRRGAVHIRLKIEPSIDIIRVGSTVDLRCITEGIPSSSLEWKKLGKTGEPDSELGSNVQTISASVLRIVDVTTSNAGTYRCSAQADTGRYTDDYTLKVQDNSLSDSTPLPAVAAKKVLLKLGDSADINCMNDLEPPVSYSWLRQGGLPSTAASNEGVLTLNKVSLKDAGLYTCVATNGEVKMEIPTFVVVHGTIPRFSSQSYIKLKTLFDAYMQFDIEILFKPEDPNGLILYNGRQTSSIGGSDFVSFGLRNGYPEFKFDMGSGHATIVGRFPLTLGKWAKAKLNRNRKEGRLVINDEEPVIGTSPGRHQGLDLDLPFYLGSVPNFNEISKSADFDTGFRGCISRLVIKNEEQNLTQAGALEWVGISECETCEENLCTNSGACQEAPNLRGYTCLCPKGFSGENCDRTGESCYPGLCGDGYCENTDRGFICKCPLGLAGSNCEHRIKIRTPSFDDTSYIAYSAPRRTEKLEITLKLNPSDSRDALILYAAQRDFGTGNYISISIKDRRLEFRIDTGSGSPVVLKSNTEIIPGSWMTVTAGRDTREAWLSIGQDMARTTLTSGQRRELLLGTFLYLGGFDTSTGNVNPNVGVSDGFRGCISHIDVTKMDIDILKSAKESSNIGECPSGNPCRESPCRNGATCLPEGSLYSCVCTADYSGLHCEKLKNDCERYQPCGGKGDCVPLANGYKCHCTKGFSGQNCTIREYFTTSFSTEGDGWVELPKALADEGDNTEVELNIVTDAPNGILMWHGQGPTTAGGISDFFSVAVVNGVVEVVFELGSGLGHITSDVRVNDGLPHRIIVSRIGNFATLTVDDKRSEGQSDGFLSKLNANGNIYIGGVPDPTYMTNGRYTENFIGCIRNIRIQNSDIIDVSNTATSTVNLRRCPVTAE